MNPTQSVKIIETMLQESRKHLEQNSFYFILWSLLLIPAGIAEYIFNTSPYNWLVWPIVSIIGGIASMIYGMKQSKKAGVKTAAGRITAYTWLSFGLCYVFVTVYAIRMGQPPHALILLLAGAATFITGGIAKFKPFVIGALFLLLAAIACGFFIAPMYHSLVFAIGIAIGYLIPGFILRKLENG